MRLGPGHGTFEMIEAERSRKQLWMHRFLVKGEDVGVECRPLVDPPNLY